MKTYTLFVTIGLLFLVASPGLAQSFNVTTFAQDLQAPTKLLLSPSGNLLVAEGSDIAEDGTVLPNTGRISRLTREGARHTLIEMLPSGPSGPNGDPLGVTALVLQDPNTLFLAITEGNIDQTSASSPLFSTILRVQFSIDIDTLQGSFTLTVPDDYATLAAGGVITLDNALGEQAQMNVLASFPQETSNLFGLALDGMYLFVANASANQVAVVHTGTGEIQTLVEFDPLLNPTDQGPPMIDAVPDNVRLLRRPGSSIPQLLVTLLSGFPFAEGLAEVRLVDIILRRDTPFITGLTRAIDVLPFNTEVGESFLVLEYAPPLAAGPGPGRLLLYLSPEMEPQVLVNTLETPTHMALDLEASELFITELFTGRIIRVGLSN